MSGERFGPYELQSLLGRGGMGEVHRAVDVRKNRGVVALKRLPAGLAGDADFHRRFLREAELAARLRDPHVIPIHDYGEIDGQPYLDMRLVEGVDLAAHLERHGPLPPAAAVEILSQVAGALDAAHREGLVHRDVKPQNMLLNQPNGADARGSDFVYLIDFGIAANVRSSRLSSSVVTGTCAYMAPERFSPNGGDHRVDVYALGCVLYQLLTGRLPFSGDFAQLLHAHLYTAPPPLSAGAPGLPRELDEVTATALAKDPDQRYPAAGALAAAARRALAGAPGAAPPPRREPVPTVATHPVAGRPTAREPGPPAGHRPPMPATLRATADQAPGQHGYAPPPPHAPAPPVRPRKGRRRRLLAYVAVGAAVLLTAAVVTAALLLVNRAPQAPPSEPTAAAPEAPAADAGATATQLTFTGAANGQLADPVMQCPSDGGNQWYLTGRLDDGEVELFVTFSQGDPGVGDFPVDTGTAPGRGLTTLTVSGNPYATDSGGTNTGTFRVDPGARSGTLDAELGSPGTNVHVSGSWTCAG